MLGVAQSFAVLVFGRLIVGIGIGLASLTAPIYISEAAPAHLRGKLLTLNTLLITAGQFAAGMVDGALSGTAGGWRWMLGLSAVPAVAMGIAFLLLPESPRWLAQHGHAHKAQIVLQRIRGIEDVSAEMAEMQQSLQEHSSDQSEPGAKTSYGWREMWRDPPVRRALTLGCGLQALQQLVGINTVMVSALPEQCGSALVAVSRMTDKRLLCLLCCLPACIA